MSESKIHLSRDRLLITISYSKHDFTKLIKEHEAIAKIFKC